jgi:hypothetical protein
LATDYLTFVKCDKAEEPPSLMDLGDADLQDIVNDPEKVLNV